MLIKTLLSKLSLLGLGLGIGLQVTTPAPEPTGPTEREIIEILAGYDVRHVPKVPNIPYIGVTDVNNHTIWIVDNQDYSSMRSTVIHELTHAARYARMEVLKDDVEEEKIVSAIEEAEYKRLFVK